MTGEELAVTRQREDIARMAVARSWTIAEEFVDNSQSAMAKVRPRFQALLDAIKSKQLDIVMAWSLDRLCRTARDRLALIEACQEHGVMISLVRGSDMDPTTPAGRLTLGILGEVATHEVAQKSDRQRRAVEQAAHAGRPPIGPAPFGFAQDRRHHHPQEAAAVRKAYSDFLTGATLAGIAREWNDEGLLSGRTRRAKGKLGDVSLWSAESVRRVLLRPTNAGLREFRGEIIGRADVEPIVSEDVFRAVQAVLLDPARRHKRPAPRNLLSGIALCGVCGAFVRAGARRPQYPVYRCADSRAHVARRGDDADAWIGGGVIEDVPVTGVIVERLSEPDLINLVKRPDDGPSVEDLRDEVGALRSRIDSVAAEFATDDTITAGQLRTITGTLRSRLELKEAELAAAGRMSALATFVTTDDVAAVWGRLQVAQKQRVIEALMEITLHPVGRGARSFRADTIEIRWKDTDDA